MIVAPKILNNICTTAHPLGCRKEVENQINYVKSKGKIKSNVKNALILGSSGGYGLASRIAIAYGLGAKTMGVSLEKAATERRTATPGWYNNMAFSEFAKRDGIEELSLNLDAFLNASKEEVIKEAKKFFDGKIDLFIYSLAAPVRTDEKTGTLYRSALKPIGKKYEGMGIDFMTEELLNVSIEPANDDDIKNTVKVMGGEDWELWTNALLEADMLAENAINIAYSYIGPEITKAVYREGTIGRAKDDIESTAHRLDKNMQKKINGHAYISVNKAVVTRASSVIPTVPLYIGILFKIMKAKGLHEGCIEQMYRLLSDKLYNGGDIPLDSVNRIRLDDWELKKDVQEEVLNAWKILNQDNLKELADMSMFRKDYMNMHGFEVEGIDYSKDVEI
ncbi:enoyl-ACP reductase FabV [Brachyspira pilosicoli]|uniref:Trans-2-enoyl-CoA reductase [NADH] n=3 Tax=Brachyspira pilosicoli TaxID=52584 RepID=D8ICF9_BRAP9|nr:enoyl-ACP reductase FabV [Brachyspira pilosicoli]ADK30832.1 trans-2-enoyl-CoA reductase (NAD(+)) [Brachyspira pilosicoli 95/1000]AGA67348.1 trans-2-enoyl-CoA reductase [Brachyspira pilosicoli P43/6/78]MBW5378454.1 trans-2-enoyl-CoA reductase family protein [Brachyspira pilosicoli]MBW5399742.1 trans-2-enoyl-CoA reductase family protein [Brachyspira pilosicoli]WIH83354.1 trans-2-enoyl-CoA reductase family protein [Brachyspira pilosicoli]